MVMLVMVVMIVMAVVVMMTHIICRFCIVTNQSQFS